jgi:hypothetical protein
MLINDEPMSLPPAAAGAVWANAEEMNTGDSSVWGGLRRTRQRMRDGRLGHRLVGLAQANADCMRAWLRQKLGSKTPQRGGL